MVKHSLKTGFSFGLTSAVITTLGLMVGLYSGTHSKVAVMGGILTIAIADAFSDALGIHISEESEIKHTQGEIWLSTIATFFAKFIFAIIFIIPVLLLRLNLAIFISIIMGMSMLGVASYYFARQQKIKPAAAILEHLFILVLVVIITNYTGVWIRSIFR